MTIVYYNGKTGVSNAVAYNAPSNAGAK